ncbi:M15 family metallopeptidase [Clostridium sp.]|uniref:M15 family metallopeptidase n=1 Tax=Clostridium sp. TaxID=1506 RepID=UPI00261902C5|nr:M15 family metallopeptidase [Clostridium sp.]
MIKKLSILMICILLILNIPIQVRAVEIKDYDTEMKQDILTLMLAYPGYILDLERSDDKVYCIMKSGKKIIYDDKIKKSHEEKLANPDLQDVLEQTYPLDKNNTLMDKNFDPGRARPYELLSEVYGNSKQSIQSNLTNLKYGYTNYQFNIQNNANTSLEAALKEIMPIAKTRGDIGSILYPASGTFNYRVIAGTGRLSPHSFGIAIDLKLDNRDYWKWSSEEQGNKRVAEYPKELVEAFEKNNLIWGGKWNHFDILHFEYRPEIILKARYFSDWDTTHKWYESTSLDKENIKGYIDIIEKGLQ